LLLTVFGFLVLVPALAFVLVGVLLEPLWRQDVHPGEPRVFIHSAHGRRDGR
jgi:hypothetical protein